jgi:hypothetical protein
MIHLFSRLSSQTLGGVQLWCDLACLHGWRIQRHAWTNHHRLLDPANKRLVSGSLAACQAEFERIKQTERLEPIRGRVVLLLHGLAGFRVTMQPLARRLEQAGFAVANLSYPSTRASLAEHARTLARIVEQMPEAEQLNFVAHSMGNIVVRHYLADQVAAGALDPRLGRFVMLAPPNHGAERAQTFGDTHAFALVLGKSGVQLGPGWPALARYLGTPPCEFGIVAGGRAGGRGYSQNILGDDDGMLSVATTRLAGARDFAIVPVRHAFVPLQERVQRYTLNFLDHGWFESADQRHPLEPVGGGN